MAVLVIVVKGVFHQFVRIQESQLSQLKVESCAGASKTFSHNQDCSESFSRSLKWYSEILNRILQEMEWNSYYGSKKFPHLVWSLWSGGSEDKLFLSQFYGTLPEKQHFTNTFHCCFKIDAESAHISWSAYCIWMMQDGALSVGNGTGKTALHKTIGKRFAAKKNN